MRKATNGIHNLLNGDIRFHFINGDSVQRLRDIPTNAVDCCITSPPYWAQRRYEGDSSLGNEKDWAEYVNRLINIFSEVKRVLKPEGSFWLNIGDTYDDKNLVGIPWRVCFALQDNGWILRNDNIWNKLKGGPCNSKDKLRNNHEHVFHFVKQKKYYFDVDSIRNPPKEAQKRGDTIVTPTGVSGSKYRRQILESKNLNDGEKKAALRALESTIHRISEGTLVDFRMVIRGEQRATHSDSTEYSGRANELRTKGYCILPYHPKGSKPSDVWNILPEDRARKDEHFAVFPEELCILPIKATSPVNGIVLDPFSGTGTAILAALKLGRRGIGIDSSERYINHANYRIVQHLDSTAE